MSDPCKICGYSPGSNVCSAMHAGPHCQTEEIASLKKELANEKGAHELCHAHRLALTKDLEIARGGTKI